MAATRIIVKNLPTYLTQDTFSKHFKELCAPTDVRLQTSKSGRSRRFGFVGFSTVEEAEKAVRHWNNTYIGSTKVSAELARSVEEEATTNYKRKRPVEDAVDTARRAQDHKESRANGHRQDDEDPNFQEFLRLNEKRSKSRTFLNDDEEFVQQAAIDDPVEDKPEEAEYEDIPAKATEEYEVIEHDLPQAVVPTELDPARFVAAVPDDADDAEWLRSRTSRTLDLAENDEPTLPTAQTRPQPVSQSASTDNIQLGTSAVAAKPTTFVPKSPVKTDQELEDDRRAADEAAKIAAVTAIKDTSRLFLRNLAFSVDQEALETLFSSYGPLQEVHIPESRSGSPKGTAYIHFVTPADAITAFSDLDGKSFHGRLLHVLPAQAKITVEKPAVPGVTANVGEKRKEERRKEAAKTRFNWNSLFLNQNAVMESTAKKFGVNKSELLDPTQSNAAVSMALAEASMLSTIKKFFLSHGVNLQSFSQSKKKDDSILLFKNLPSRANEDELRKLVESAGGVVRRIVIPEVGGLAIVEVVDANQGKQVFSKLAYRKFDDGLIYLEKGPVNTFTSAADVESSTQKQVKDQTSPDDESEDSDNDAEKATIFVKNLNFETRAPDLTKIFESLKGFRQATVKTKPNPKDPTTRLSMGFGFLEFASEVDAKSAISTMQGFSLHNHSLLLKLTTGKSSSASTTTRHEKPSSGGTKLVVKNLPFETTKSDIHQLFSTYGTITSLRLPKSHNASLRGFAFLEFSSKRESKNAMDGVSGTHLLGRRMVIEYANAEVGGDEGIDRLVERTRKRRSAVETVEGGKRKRGKVNLDGVEEGFE